jgi:hypothetical protein
VLTLKKIIFAHDALAIQTDVVREIIRKFRSADFTEPCHVFSPLHILIPGSTLKPLFLTVTVSERGRQP